MNSEDSLDFSLGSSGSTFSTLKIREELKDKTVETSQESTVTDINAENKDDKNENQIEKENDKKFSNISNFDLLFEPNVSFVF